MPQEHKTHFRVRFEKILIFAEMAHKCTLFGGYATEERQRELKCQVKYKQMVSNFTCQAFFDEKDKIELNYLWVCSCKQKHFTKHPSKFVRTIKTENWFARKARDVSGLWACNFFNFVFFIFVTNTINIFLHRNPALSTQRNGNGQAYLLTIEFI